MLNNTLIQFKLLWMPYQIKSLHKFLEKINNLMQSALRPQFDLYPNLYKTYLETCQADNVKPLSARELCKIFSFYGMKNKTKTVRLHKEKKWHHTPGTKGYYGMEIKIDQLKMMIKDCEEVVVSNGTTVVMQNGYPHYLRFSLIPVNNKIAEAILGRKVDDLNKNIK